MIQANDVKLNRYFNCPRTDQNPFRIDTIEFLTEGFGKVGMYPTVDGVIKTDLHPLTWQIENLTPIPLTPEVLRDCGFQINDDSCFPDCTLGDFRVNFAIHDGVVEYGRERIYEFIPPLHQLQNLYFALTQTELTYKPK